MTDGPGGRPYRVAIELFGVTIAVWIAYILIEKDPSHGLNVPYFGAKWIAYTYAMANTVFVLAPAATIIAITTLIYLLRWRRPHSYWKLYRSSYMLLIIAAALGLYFVWYGGSR